MSLQKKNRTLRKLASNLCYHLQSQAIVILIGRPATFANAIPGFGGVPFHRKEHHTLGWEPDKHRRTLAGDAFDRHAAAVEFGELARQRQAEPRALEPFRKAVIHLPEMFERTLDFVGRHADACI